MMIYNIESLSLMAELDPQNPWAYFKRAQLYQKLDNHTMAIKDYNECININKYDPEFWLGRGTSREKLGHVGDAEEDFNHAITLNPNFAKSYAARGWFYSSNHKSEHALADYNRAIALDPLEPSYRYQRGMILAEMGKFLESMDDFNDCIKISPKEAKFYFRKAYTVLYHSGNADPTDALPGLSKSIRLNPSADWYRLERGYIRYYLGQWAEAAEDFSAQRIYLRYENCYNMVFYILIWYYLSKTFQGGESEGMRFINSYLKFYNANVEQFFLMEWPTPIARLLAGEIDENQLRSLASLGLASPDLTPVELTSINTKILECDFIIGQLHMIKNNIVEAKIRLDRACRLPQRNPMRWVAIRQLENLSTEDGSPE